MTTVRPRPAAGALDAADAHDELSVVDLVDRLLEKGAALTGDVVLSVAGIDLVRLGLRAVLQGIDDESGRPRAVPSGTREAAAAPRALSESGRSTEPVGTAVPVHRAGTVARARAAGEVGGIAAPLPYVPRRRDGRVAFQPGDVERGLVQLVLTVVELLREVLERQALRRVDTGSLGGPDVERLGRAFLELEQRMEDLKRHFGLTDDDVALRLGVVRDVG